MMKNKKAYEAAFSLIEVLVFVVVFSLFFIIAASVVTTTLRITKENQNKIRGLHHAEELREWLRAEKEINWGGTVHSGLNPPISFTEYATWSSPSPSTTYCFSSSPIVEWPSTGASGCDFSLDGQFRRIATFSATVSSGYVERVTVNTTTEWKDGEFVHFTPLLLEFSIWE